ncbi:MAG: DUF2497 domain-containing protein [Pseudomonadota bacterium]
MRQTSEPSVEEILESIKRVIARDNRAHASEDRLQPGAAADSDADDAEVLELTGASELEPLDGPAEPAPLITEDAINSMRDSLAALSMMAAPGASPQIVRSGETSLESLTRELLRPMLADWLDNHLPPLVERLVAAEIARIVGKKV